MAGEPRRYEYPRYFFTNVSDDIRRLCTDTLDALGVAWRQANACNISVARKDSVALHGPLHRSEVLSRAFVCRVATAVAGSSGHGCFG